MHYSFPAIQPLYKTHCDTIVSLSDHIPAIGVLYAIQKNSKYKCSQSNVLQTKTAFRHVLTLEICLFFNNSRSIFECNIHELICQLYDCCDAVDKSTQSILFFIFCDLDPQCNNVQFLVVQLLIEYGINVFHYPSTYLSESFSSSTSLSIISVLLFSSLIA
jgi:hypothetical protein